MHPPTDNSDNDDSNDIHLFLDSSDSVQDEEANDSVLIQIMPSELEYQGPSQAISPVLFLTVDGEPMRFFLRPGYAKLELQPHIKAGGGVMCKVQEPGAILLVDPKEMGSHMESTVAHWYVSTQYIRDCIEKNKQLELEDYRKKPDYQKTHCSSKQDLSYTSRGRTAYTAEEDAAIISYVATREKWIKGIRMWREMEEKHVTTHSWQSMKCRYLNILCDRPVEVQEDGDVDAKMNRQQTDTLQADRQQTSGLPIHDEGSQSTNFEPQVTCSTNPDVEMEDSRTAQADAQPPSPSPLRAGKTKMMPETSTPIEPSPPLRRSVRRRIWPDTSPSATPSGKKVRSSSSLCLPKASASSSSPAPPPPPQLTDGIQSADQAATSDKATNSVTQKKAGKTAKRMLGILEMATKEFEEYSESDMDETCDLTETTNPQRHEETSWKRPTDMPTVTAEPRAEVPAPVASPDPAANPPEDKAESPPPKLPPLGPTASGTALSSTPKPHLFIFEGESQEEGTQNCDDAAAPICPQPISKEARVFSLTQCHLEEDMQRIKELIEQTKQDLVSVTKALLRASGDFSAALLLLQNPSSSLGPFWSRCDDHLLLTADPPSRTQLVEKYGELAVAKRLVFLEGE